MVETKVTAGHFFNIINKKRDMKTKLTIKETLILSITLFGLFFGAGNLIFPVHLGQLAGSNVVLATIGFVVTGVTIPILAVASIGITHSNGLQRMCEKKVGKGFAYFFTTLLYLTIGPFFAIPRCCTTTFTTGVYPLMNNFNERICLLIFSFIFFALVLYFSLKPSEIMKWVGKVITPIFLVFFSILIITTLTKANVPINSFSPEQSYINGSFVNGLLEGYNTMDAIAGLAFGVIIVNCVRDLGIHDGKLVAIEIVKAGVITAILMSIIYFASTIMGAKSLSVLQLSENGGIALAQIAELYLGRFGLIVLALTIGLACLKTAIGLVTSCCETFVRMFPNTLDYKKWAIVFCGFSFVVSNFGLTTIINYSIPVLMFLYPIAIVLTIVGIFSYRTDNKVVFRCTLVGTIFAAIFDFIKTLPFNIDVSFMSKILPFFDIGFSWIVPSAIGLIVGLLLSIKNKKTN